jgi:hypothetical protein
MFSLPLHDVCNDLDIPLNVIGCCHMSNYVIIFVVKFEQIGNLYRSFALLIDEHQFGSSYVLIKCYKCK